jgi:hypothetical protein
MVSAACVSSPIPHLISVEVIEGLVSTCRIWTAVAVMWIETVIHVPIEFVGAVKPRAGSDEHATGEPLGPVVPVWGTVVWGEVVVAIWANRLCSDIDGDLGGCRTRNAQHSGNQTAMREEFTIVHKSLLTIG